ncbi:hypothetical protein [Methanothermobacter tenebrarum]|uniref:Uncharacterized protein n=1 Tax=Methanothermobacter tenebrarum TaxID=680118 RepID=A0A328P834_9EURY|nr:hypothetical protein [Methanothermobacter tenebrarum]NPV64740.1 hypothetical protein [Methanobacteriaceae archaeon]RAO78447.1 hypothetical protein DPC56_08040 [Methanothermobacter tenebrarum]
MTLSRERLISFTLVLMAVFVFTGCALSSTGIQRYKYIGLAIITFICLLLGFFHYYGIIDKFKRELVVSFLLMGGGIFFIMVGLVSGTAEDKIYFPVGIFAIIASLYFVSRLLRG